MLNIFLIIWSYISFCIYLKILYNYIDMNLYEYILRVITLQRKRIHICGAGIEKLAAGIS